MPRRSAVAEAQADGLVLWEMKKTAAREAWQAIELGLRAIANIVTSPVSSETKEAGGQHGTVA
jgi:chromosome partitioning protein